MILLRVVPFAFFLCFVQALELLYDDTLCDVLNTEYIDPDCSLDILEDSEYGNYLNVHLEIKKPIPTIITRATILGMERNGEYTQDMGIVWTMNVCETLAGPPNIVHDFVKTFGMTPDKCPPEPGVYGNDHFVINETSGFPESIPSGKYFLNVTILDEETPLGIIGIYVTIM